MRSPDLLTGLEEIVRALERAADGPVLIGGLAIAIRNGALPIPDLDPILEEGGTSNPSVLARFVHATADIDLVVRHPEVDRASLEDLGFKPVRREPTRLRRDGLVVDLLPCAPSDHSIHIPPALCVGEWIRVPGSSLAIRIPEPAALIILKARAWHDRSRGSDLADIASLALAAADQADQLRGRIEALASVVPQARDDLRHAARAFETGDKQGPGEFFRVVQSALQRSRYDDDWDFEGTIRGIASDQVLSVLRGFRA